GTVSVEIVQSPPNFQGSNRNGVTTSPWGAFPEGSFKFIKISAAPRFQLHDGDLATSFVYGSTIGLKLRDDKITLVTGKGKVAISVADIRKIELATRIPDDVAAKIEAAIKTLGRDK